MTNSDRSFGDWLRRHRRVLDLTQEQLARQVGCSAILLRKLESEERRPSQQIVERLADVFGLPPEARPAFLRFARGDPFAAPSGDKATGSLEFPLAPRDNLPLQLTSFIGREKEIAEIRGILTPSPAPARHPSPSLERGKSRSGEGEGPGVGVRLLTLTGVGGSGKTRLGWQAAMGLLASFPDGAWWVDLAPLSDPGLVLQTVASVLGVKENPDRPLLATLIDHLRRKQALLILDNCEHLIQACTELAASLLRACPHLAVLATSREAMRADGGSDYPVPTLSLPDSRSNQSLEDLAGSEAVQLFVDRAQAALPGFALTDDNAAAVAQVCRQLDGIPLAIELAAARVKFLRVEQIAARLSDRFQLLTDGSRGALPRHQTLAALIDWSYDLLSAPERLLLQRLAVFMGGWTLEAAEAVCAADGLGSSEVLGLLAQLANKSLVLAERKPGGTTRYRMLETIRQYALAKLENAGDQDEVRRHHAAYYLPSAEAGAPRPMVMLQPAWLRRMELELDNLRAALVWSLSDPSRVELALNLASVFTHLWYAGAYISEARGWLERALAQPEAANYPSAQAAAISYLGGLLGLQGDLQAAETHLAQASRLFQELGDRLMLAHVLERVGWVAREQGDAAAACARLEECLALYRELGDQEQIPNVANTLGEALILRGDLVTAKALLEENLARARQRGDINANGWALNHLGHIAQLQGEYEQAVQLHETSLPLFHQLGARNMGHEWAHRDLGEIALAQGDSRTAASHFAEALAVSKELGDREIMAWCPVGLAGVAALEEEPELAARLWGAAEALRQFIGVRDAPASRATRERLMAAAQQQLGEEAFAAAWAEGAKMTWEQAIDLALDAV